MGRLASYLSVALAIVALAFPGYGDPPLPRIVAPRTSLASSPLTLDSRALDKLLPLLRERAPALPRGRPICPSATVAYLVESTVGVPGAGLRCVSPDRKAWLGLGYWRDTVRGKYLHLGRFRHDASGQIVGGSVLDLGWTTYLECDGTRALPEKITGGVPGQRALTFDRPSPATFVVREWAERWTLLPDGRPPALLSFPLPFAYEGCASTGAMQGFYRDRSSAETEHGYFCSLPSTSDPLTAEPLAWIAETVRGGATGFAFGWTTAPRTIAHTFLCNADDPRCREPPLTYSLGRVLEQYEMAPRSIGYETSRGVWYQAPVVTFARPEMECVQLPSD